MNRLSFRSEAFKLLSIGRVGRLSLTSSYQRWLFLWRWSERCHFPDRSSPLRILRIYWHPLQVGCMILDWSSLQSGLPVDPLEGLKLKDCLHRSSSSKTLARRHSNLLSFLSSMVATSLPLSYSRVSEQVLDFNLKIPLFPPFLALLCCLHHQKWARPWDISPSPLLF